MKNLLLILTFATACAANAQQEVVYKWGGGLDFNYARTSAEAADADRLAGNTNYVGGYPIYNDQFTVNSARLNFSANLGEDTIFIKFGYGPGIQLIAAPFAANYLGNPHWMMTEGYISHRFGDSGLTVEAGRVMGFVGFEGLHNDENFNYTRSYAWYIETAAHTGIRAKYGFGGGKYEAALHSYNGAYATNKDIDSDHAKAMGASLWGNPIAPMTFYVAHMATNDDQVHYSHTDVNVAYKVIPELDLAVNYEQRVQQAELAGSDEFTVKSLAFYAHYLMNKWHFAARYEMFEDDGANALFTGVAKYKITGITGTVSYDISNALQARLEYRQDKADEDMFQDDTQTATDSQDVKLLAFLYKF